MIITTSHVVQAPKMRLIISSIYGHLKYQRKRQLIVLFLVMLASGASEILSLGAVVPFLGVLSDPEKLWRQDYVQILAKHFGLTQPIQLILPVSILFATTAIVATVIRIINLWFSNRLAAAIGSDLSSEAYKRTLYQPYYIHVQSNTSDLIASTTNMIARTVTSLSAFLQLAAALIVALALLGTLTVIEPLVATGTIILFGLIYVVIAFSVRSKLRMNSISISNATRQQVKLLQEGLGSIRDVLLDGNQLRYVAIFKSSDISLRKLIANNQFLSAFPRYAVEAIGLVGIALFGGIQVMRQGLEADVIPLLGVLALGAQRLLPSFQQIYRSWSVIKGFSADIATVLKILNQPIPKTAQVSRTFQFQNSIQFDKVNFSYDPSILPVVCNLDLVIRRGECIGLVGKTGSGKSTIVDILMGLLSPSSGHINVDGLDLNHSDNTEVLASWRASIAHVPQNIYLTDSSIAENIAFGELSENIDMEMVMHSARLAQLDAYVSSTREGYQTIVGEQGIRLSGGQRQRIGIARALYKNSPILVLDEATSALDGLTEKSVMESIENLSSNLTIIIIAHRVSTLRRCDRVIRLENGTVIADGTPSKILDIS